MKDTTFNILLALFFLAMIAGMNYGIKAMIKDLVDDCRLYDGDNHYTILSDKIVRRDCDQHCFTNLPNRIWINCP